MMEKKNNNLALCKVCLTSPNSIAQAASEVLYSTSVGKRLFNVDRDKKGHQAKAEMKIYHYTHFRNKDGRSELMLRDIYENESSKVIN